MGPSAANPIPVPPFRSYQAENASARSSPVFAARPPLGGLGHHAPQRLCKRAEKPNSAGNLERGDAFRRAGELECR
jgi:hypothetical protein